MSTPALHVDGVHVHLGKVHALNGLDLTIEPGEATALLGANGAGKTTLVRTVSTILRPETGSVRVFGHDTVRDSAKVRGLIGLAAQEIAVDKLLTGRENLVMFGRLARLGSRAARESADRALTALGLADRADDRVATYSGGMMRRLDLALMILLQRGLLLLDEPTTGLDPAARSLLWGLIGDLVDAGTAVLLTTQYLEEADRLAERVHLMREGQIVESGTGSSLKDRYGSTRIEFAVEDQESLARLEGHLRSLSLGVVEVMSDELRAQLRLGEHSDAVPALVQSLAGSDGIADVSIRRPTLDDVFLGFEAAGGGVIPPTNSGEEVHST